MRTCPTTAFEIESFVAYVLSQFGGIDITPDDLVTKWLNEALNFRESVHRIKEQDIIALFHNNSNGFPLLGKQIGMKILGN